MQYPYTNSLINETSPYLLQHAHNPVNWMAWNEEAWKKARAEDKLVIISIGYSACHWCHVMEHESFEDTTVAKIMNGHFVSIKVDREERPDVDQVYMDAVQLISGHGGWPLNAIALPDGRPIYAGTYYPKENWKQVLNYFIDYWKNHKDEALQRATEITQGIKVMDTIEPRQNESLDASLRKVIFDRLDSVTDYEKGGRKGAPKFPMPVIYEYLLENYYYTGNEKALKAVTVTLDNMMNGGIYDQVGGGFARYSVDGLWEIPHFEKMLYDNAQLVSIYSKAYRVTKDERYKQVVFETLEFIERELSDASGGFYSALDADSEGEEGKYYVWSYDELKGILGSDFDEFARIFNVSKEGNFEGKNNLVRNPNAVVDEVKLKHWKAQLRAERNTRVRPRLDDKILTSWDALMLSGYVEAYNAFNRSLDLDRAIQCAEFIKGKQLQSDYSLKRNYKDGKSTISGFLDDYSFTCQAFIDLYEATFDEHWLATAKAIANYTIQHFYNANTGMFFYTSVNDEPLIARKTETQDNVIPASNSGFAKVLFRLGLLYDNKDYTEKSRRALNNVLDNMRNYPSYHTNWAILADWFISPPCEVAITGPEALKLKKSFNQSFFPDCVFTGTAQKSSLPLLQDKFKNNETWIYVCRDKTCQLPVKSVAEALNQIAH